MSGLEEEFGGRVRARNLDATTAAGRTRIGELGFKTHGAVIETAEGRVLWTQPDHRVRIEDLRRALRELLARRSRRNRSGGAR